MKLSDSFIDDLLTKIDITEIIGSRINLRKVGSNFHALCPFHTEKTPSFTVSPAKQFFHCFGCGVHGSAIGFLMRFENLEFIDAVEYLANLAGMEIPKSANDKAEPVFTELYNYLEKAANCYYQELRNSPRAIEYLKSRGLTGQMCQHFTIGYANANWDNLSKIHAQSSSAINHLINAGMLLQKNQATFSRFRDRIMFPIRDRRGRIIGFGGRTLGNDPAKYINSPETPIFHKGNELFGLFEAKKQNKNLTQIIVVEGYMDVVALAQHGITQAVATLGTAITPKQIQLLVRQTEEIIFCFDGDQAGKAAAVRALENILPHLKDGLQIKFSFLPETDDPDSMIRRVGKTAFLDYLNQALSLPDFFLQHISHDIKNITTMEGKSRLAKEAQKYLSKIPMGIFRQLLVTKLSEITKVNIDELQNYFSDESTAKPVEPIIDHIDQFSVHVRCAILLLAHHPSWSDLIENIDIFSQIKLPEIDLFIRLIKFTKNQPNSSIGAILEYWRNNYSDIDKLGAIIAKGSILDFIDSEGLKNEFIGSIQRIYQYQNEQKIELLLNQAATGEITLEERKLLQQLIANTKKIVEKM